MLALLGFHHILYVSRVSVKATIPILFLPDIKTLTFFSLSYRAVSSYYQRFIYSPTDAPVSCLKKILKFTLKFTLKQLRHVSVLQLHHHHQAHQLVLTKVTVIKLLTTVTLVSISRNLYVHYRTHKLPLLLKF